MGSMKLTIVAFVLTAMTCQGEIVIPSSYPDKSTARLVDDLVHIVTSCPTYQTNGVGLAGHLPRTLLKRLTVQHSISVGLIDISDRRFEEGLPQPDLQFRQKLKVFIIEAASFADLDALIEMNIKQSNWWNHMASFFILDLSDGCVNAEDFLYLAWQRDLINAKVICRLHKSGRIIFNYNPFSSQAPASWRPVKVLKGMNAHPFTLLRRKYQENETLCVDLDFEKSKNLGGYPIRVEGFPLGGLSRETSERGDYEYWSERERMISTIARTLNATLTFSNREGSAINLGSFIKGGREIELNSHLLQLTWSTKREEGLLTYPHSEIQSIIVTHFRGLKSQLNKILSVIDVASRYGIIVVYFITLIFFKFFVHQDLVSTWLNLIRITTNVGFTNLTNDTGSRIYMGCLLFFAVTMQGIFKGDLAALLTKNIPVRNVDTVQDLRDLGYKRIHVVKALDTVLDDSGLRQFVTVAERMEDCALSVKNDTTAACLAFAEGGVYTFAQKFTLHLSKDLGIPTHVGHRIRWNWPLEGRVNDIIARMVSASVLQTWDVKSNSLKSSDFYVDEAVKKNKDFKNLELDEVLFAFVILGIGLVCATIVFVIELATKYEFIFDVTVTRQPD